jgi:acyl-CoA dehydrogenase
MSETRTILEDSAAKLFAGFEEPAVLRRVEAGDWPNDIWARIAGLGLQQIFAGASDDPWRDACVVLKACGRQVVPAPLAETLMAGALLAEAGLEPMEGALTLAAPSNGVLALSDDGLASGTLVRVPWGRRAGHVVAPVEGGIAVLPVAAATLTEDRCIGREPRDTLVFENVAAVVAAPLRDGAMIQYGALMRAAQMAGAIEALLALTVQYARERSQFGKPIGSFQAIQHQLAILAGHSAAATRAVDAAFERIAEGGDSGFEAAVAKIRVGEAAGVAASIAHQTHGAIGFTDEHRLHYFTRRLWSWRTEFGSEGFWSARLGARMAAYGPEQFWPIVTAAG